VLFLDVVSDREAGVVAVIDAGQWSGPSPATAKLVARVAQARASYTLLPSIAGGTSASLTGSLQGSVRNSCGDLFTALEPASPALGFGVAGAPGPIRYVPLRAAVATPEQRAVVAGVLRRATGLTIEPQIDASYSVDLDGNGKPEVVLQARHPDLATDFADYKPEYYSLIVVLSDQSGAEPAYVGYLQAIQPPGSFEVVSVDAVADVDGDGRLELLVRARHAEGFQTQVFRYQGGLREIFHSVGGEGSCEGVSQ
jgi:hypothetical protein